MKRPMSNSQQIGQYTSYERRARREALILQYLYLVQREAQRIYYHVMKRVPLEDLVSSGTIGLIRAVESFEDKEGSSFKRYAKQRIRGSIIDELRKMDILPRGVRKRRRRIEWAIADLTAKLGKRPQEVEIADELGVTVETYRHWEREGNLADLIDNGGTKVRFDGRVDGLEGFLQGGAVGGASSVEHDDLLEHVEEVLRTLPERERLVISLYYYEELTMKEIGKVLHISESRVSQIHSEVLAKLRARLKGHGVKAVEESG